MWNCWDKSPDSERRIRAARRRALVRRGSEVARSSGWRKPRRRRRWRRWPDIGSSRSDSCSRREIAESKRCRNPWNASPLGCQSPGSRLIWNDHCWIVITFHTNFCILTVHENYTLKTFLLRNECPTNIAISIEL